MKRKDSGINPSERGTIARKPSQERKGNGKKVNIISPYYKYNLRPETKTENLVVILVSSTNTILGLISSQI